jgi:cell division protein FtsW
LINIGVNVGLLPTKGITLPFMSYGGNSIIVACVVISMLLRIDFENRQARPPKALERVAWGVA